MALSCQRVYDAFVGAGVSFWAGVPDSLLKSFCAYVTDNAPADRHVITANEGSAVGVAAGHYLATGEPAVVYLQNSGLGNTVNPLTSLTDNAVYGIPMLVVVGWRGEPGVKDEPQHVKMGGVTQATLDAIGVPYDVLPTDQAEAEAVITRSVAAMMESHSPRALLVRKGSFEDYKLQSETPDTLSLTREAALEHILAAFDQRTIVVSTTGKPSREIFELRVKNGQSHDSDFLIVGSMGHCSQIALGVALRKPDRQVLCVDGDGAVLMHMGGLATIGSLQPTNFKHVVLNNGAHDSVGGQPTVAHEISLADVARACKYDDVWVVDDADALTARLADLRAARGPALLEVRVRKGARKDLGRPTRAPAETKRRFMEFVGGDE